LQARIGAADMTERALISEATPALQAADKRRTWW